LPETEPDPEEFALPIDFGPMPSLSEGLSESRSRSRGSSRSGSGSGSVDGNPSPTEPTEQTNGPRRRRWLAVIAALGVLAVSVSVFVALILPRFRPVDRGGSSVDEPEASGSSDAPASIPTFAVRHRDNGSIESYDTFEKALRYASHGDLLIGEDVPPFDMTAGQTAYEVPSHPVTIRPYPGTQPVLVVHPKGPHPFLSQKSRGSLILSDLTILVHFEGPGTGEPPPPPEDPPTVLLPGQVERFSFDPRPEPTLYSGENSFTVEVPTDAVRVTLTLESDDPEVDADLYARFDQDNDLADGQVVSDYSSTSLSGDERIVIDAASDPPLRAGALFVSIVVFTENAPSSGSLAVEIEVGSPAEPPTGETLTSGVPADFELPPVDGPTLFTGPSVYEIDVPEGATQLDVKVTTLTAGVDVDLHLSRGPDPRRCLSRANTTLEQALGAARRDR